MERACRRSQGSPSPAQEVVVPAVNPKPRSSGPALHVTACALLAAGNEILPFVFLSSLRGDEGSNNLCHTSTRMLNTRQTFMGKYSYSHSRVQQCKRTGLLHNVRFMPCCDTQLLHAEKPKLSSRTTTWQQSKAKHPKPCGGALPAAWCPAAGPWTGNKDHWSQPKW